MPTDVPFHALGKPRHLDPGYHAAKQRETRTLRESVERYRRELLETHPDLLRRADVVHTLGMMLEVTHD